MDQKNFASFMDSAKMLASADYFQGYQYGLRRLHHGENFGTDEQIDRLRERGGAVAQGLQDGLAGQEPRIYCTQNDGDCSTCSLVNYGHDCRGRSI